MFVPGLTRSSFIQQILSEHFARCWGLSSEENIQQAKMSNENTESGTSLAAQRSRLRLPLQGVQV